MARLGIRDRDVQREFRRTLLTEGDDWVHQKNRILYSESAEHKIAHHLHKLAQEPSDLPQDTHSPEKPRNGASAEAHAPIVDPVRLLEFPEFKKPQRLIVIRPGSHLKNSHVLECRLEGASQSAPVQFVRVADNRHFLPGTATGVVLAFHDHGNVWKFAGNPAAAEPVPRCPRWKGKW